MAFHPQQHLAGKLSKPLCQPGQSDSENLARIRACLGKEDIIGVNFTGAYGLASAIIEAGSKNDAAIVSRILNAIICGDSYSCFGEQGQFSREIISEIVAHVLGNQEAIFATINGVLGVASSPNYFRGLIICEKIIDSLEPGKRKRMLDAISGHCDSALRRLTMGVRGGAEDCRERIEVLFRKYSSLPAGSISRTDEKWEHYVQDRLSACELLRHLIPERTLACCAQLLKQHREDFRVFESALSHIARLIPHWKDSPPYVLVDIVKQFENKVGSSRGRLAEYALDILIALGIDGEVGVKYATVSSDKPAVVARAMLHAYDVNGAFAERAYKIVARHLKDYGPYPSYVDDALDVLVNVEQIEAPHLMEIAREGCSTFAAHTIRAIGRSRKFTISLSHVAIVCMDRGDESVKDCGVRVLSSEKNLPTTRKCFEHLARWVGATSDDKQCCLKVITLLGANEISSAYPFAYETAHPMVRHEALKLLTLNCVSVDKNILRELCDFSFKSRDSTTVILALKLAAALGRDGTQLRKKVSSLCLHSDEEIRKEALLTLKKIPRGWIPFGLVRLFGRL